MLLSLFPAYSLVDDGYDVWLGNQRGNRYSRGHESLKYTDSEYWDFKYVHISFVKSIKSKKFFSLDIAAADDIRTVLKYIAKETGMGGSIIYVGHSKGSTLIFMYASEYSEESKSLLKGIIALSPIAYLEPRSHIKFLFTMTPTFGVN
jgi:lysosomal acid lipase/cholesteryl ester hydrolase